MSLNAVIIGAGGFAREVAWLLEDVNQSRSMAGLEPYQLLGHVVSDLSKHDDHHTMPLGGYTWLKEHDVHACFIGVGTPVARLRIAEEVRRILPGVEWPALIHSTVHYDLSTLRIAAGALICAGCLLTVNVEINEFAMLNLACTVGHEAIIGEGVVLNPTVNISGGAKVGKGVLIGSGAQVLQYVEVGEGAIVGAGAVVSKNVERGITVVGIPAKKLEKKVAPPSVRTYRPRPRTPSL